MGINPAGFIPIMGLFLKSQGGRGLLLVVFFGTLGLSMQDILLEPYGGEILGLSVAATTNLTAVWVFGALFGLFLASRSLKRKKGGPIKSIVFALFTAIGGLCFVIMSDPMNLASLYFFGSFLIGLGLSLIHI